MFKQIVNNAIETYSQNFLTAHGFEKEKGWDVLTNMNQKLYKFIEMCEPIGLKSP